MRRVLSVLVVAATACTPSGTSGADVALNEFTIAAPQRIAAGRVHLDIANTGEFGHTLVVSKTDGTVVASTEVLGPGESAILDLDLEPGRYMFSCRIVVQTPTGEIVDHYARGMAATIDVVPP